MDLDPTRLPSTLAPVPDDLTWRYDPSGWWELGVGIPGPLWTRATAVSVEWLASAPAAQVELWVRRVVDSIEGRGLTLTCDGCGLRVGYWAHLHTDPTPLPPPCPTCGTEFTVTEVMGEAAEPPAPVGVPAAPSGPPPRRPPWVRGPASHT